MPRVLCLVFGAVLALGAVACDDGDSADDIERDSVGDTMVIDLNADSEALPDTELSDVPAETDGTMDADVPRDAGDAPIDSTLMDGDATEASDGQVPEADALVDNSLPIYPTAELDGLTQTEVLALRAAAVDLHPELGFAADYAPNMAVWEQIVDGLPWWGILGQFYYGAGDQSPEGTSEETRFILNPYIFVYPDFYSMYAFYDPALVEPAMLVEGKFPLDVPVESLDFDVGQKLITLEIDVTSYVTAINPYSSSAITPQTLVFGLQALNARDFGLDYLYVDIPNSVNVEQPEYSATATQIRYYIHQGGSCAKAGGCNNGSPFQAPFHGISLSDLPAELMIHLWPESPTDVSAPDYRVLVRFR